MASNKISFKIEREKTSEELVAFSIVKKLQDAGFETYFAGGAVRDELLNIPSYDIDIATFAKPDEIKKLFPEAYDRGKAFGVMAVNIDEKDFEIATFRTDIGTTDHRRPEKVEFATSEIDAKRRDITINGLFYDPVKEEIIDFVDGLADLKRKIIRFIGNPEERIEEDYLRMLRAVRFSARFNFEVEDKSKKAIMLNANKILEISAERIREELSKMLLNENRTKSLELLWQLKLLKEILPEVELLKNVTQPPEFHSEGDVWTHTILALNNINNLSKEDMTAVNAVSEELVWTVLLHDTGKPETQGFRTVTGKSSITFFEHDVKSAEIAEVVLKRLHFSHHFIQNVSWAIRQHMRIVNAFRGMSERKIKKLFSDDNIQLLLNLTYGDLSASLRPDGKPEMEMYEDAKKLMEKFEKESDAEKAQIKKFTLVTGKDIMEKLKIIAGPEVGKIKSEIEQAYLDGKITTQKDALEMLEGYKDK